MQNYTVDAHLNLSSWLDALSDSGKHIETKHKFVAAKLSSSIYHLIMHRVANFWVETALEVIEHRKGQTCRYH